MIDDLDIYRAAQAMLKRYGVESAAFEAVARADEYLKKGRLDGLRVWIHILKAIDVLLHDVQGSEALTVATPLQWT